MGKQFAISSLSEADVSVATNVHPIAGGLIPDANSQRLRLDESIASDAGYFLELTALLTLFALSMIAFNAWADYYFEEFVLTSIWWISAYALLSWNGRALLRRTSHLQVGLREAFACWTKATAFTIVTVYLMKSGENVSRLWMISMSLAGYACIALSLFGMSRVARALATRGVIGRRVAIYSYNDNTPALIDFIHGNCGPFTRVVALFDSRSRGEVRLPVDNDLEGLLEQARLGNIDTVMIDLPWQAQARIDEIVQRLETVDVDIMMAPIGRERDATKNFDQLGVELMGSRAALSLYRRPMRGSGALMKIMLDKFLAITALLIMLPLLILIMIAIRVDSRGPIFFRQKRCGFNNRPFNMLKFRSMYVEMSDHDASKLCVRNDTRITRVGAFLRRTSLDELPQLINVLRGDMSLVGPRPHAYGAKAAERTYEQVVQRYAARHRVRPGLTGLAQVRGFRGNTEQEKDILDRVDSDLEYISRWSLSQDLAIIFRTGFTFLFQKRAY